MGSEGREKCKMGEVVGEDDRGVIGEKGDWKKRQWEGWMEDRGDGLK